jgi:hypothetical protein
MRSSQRNELAASSRKHGRKPTMAGHTATGPCKRGTRVPCSPFAERTHQRGQHRRSLGTARPHPHSPDQALMSRRWPQALAWRKRPIPSLCIEDKLRCSGRTPLDPLSIPQGLPAAARRTVATPSARLAKKSVSPRVEEKLGYARLAHRLWRQGAATTAGAGSG